jgi:GxxExxY protein
MGTDNLIHRDLSEAIIGCAMIVHNTPKTGLREKTYERAPIHELGKRGIKVDQQKQFDVRYDGKVIDTMIPDLIVADSVIGESKCVTAFDDAHFAQMIGYLAITGLRLGLLINFKHTRLQWKRGVN